MSDDERAARLAEIRERAEQATPGRWHWRGNLSSKSIELRAILSGTQRTPSFRFGSYTVMDFVRWGFQSATPRFLDPEHVMRPPVTIPSAPHNDWDVVAIDHPDARFIEHSRSDIDFLLAEVDRLGAALGDAQEQCYRQGEEWAAIAATLDRSNHRADRLPGAMAVIRRLWRKRSICIASNESQWHVINEGGAREQVLRTTLATLVADDFNAWGASIYEEWWECHWCHAHGAEINDEPRAADHNADCPWLAARALVGHAVPVAEPEPDEDDEDTATMMQILRDDGEFMAQLGASGAGNAERVIRDVAEVMKVHLPGILRAREEGGE